MQSPDTFCRDLLRWFARHSRDLPWRRTYAPYHVWISEIMLQQTQVDRVVAYFERWIGRFPDIASLAAAGEDEVMNHWEGLGYYSRARNLHLAARELADRNTLPEDYHELLKLPGIGPYTAGAIMSIAFNRDYPVIDANVERLFARLFDIRSPIKEKSSRDFLTATIGSLLPPGRARNFNQALMELGALVCLPRNPRCPACPVASHCRARELGTVHQRPLLPAKRKTVFIEMATGILERGGKILIQKRLADDVWANLWEFPGGRLKEGESAEDGLVREYAEETGLTVCRTEKITSVAHSYMHYRVTLHGFFCQVREETAEPALNAAQENRWVRPAELKHYAFPAGHRKLIDYMTEKGLFTRQPEDAGKRKGEGA